MKSYSKRIIYIIITIILIILGLMSRKFINYIPIVIAPYLGDALWAAMVYFGFRFIFPQLNKNRTFIIAIIFSFIIEISQLYHAPWIDNIRATTLGALILGFGFLWSDLICYSVGIIIAFLVDRFLFRL